MSKRILTAFFTALLAVCLLPLGAWADEAQREISTADDLMSFASDSATNPNLNAKLMNDIDMSGKQWTGIGSDSPDSHYSGTFDGNGKTITGLKGTEGLVRNLSGTVQNVILEGVDISSSHGNLGAIAGHSTGTICNCYVSGSVTGSGYSVGGIVGWNEGGTIEGCIAVCTVTNTATNPNRTTGGLVGSNYHNGSMNTCLYIISDGSTEKFEGDTHYGSAKIFTKSGTNYKLYTSNSSGQSLVDTNRETITQAFANYTSFNPVANQFKVAKVTFENGDTKYFDSAKDAFDAADGHTAEIYFLNSASYAPSLNISNPNSSITLNMADHVTLDAYLGVLQGSLTIYSGTISKGVQVSGGTLSMQGGAIQDGIHVSGGVANISGGTISGSYTGGTLYITGGTVQLSGGVINGTISTFANNPPVTNYLADGYAYKLDSAWVTGSPTSLSGTISIVPIPVTITEQPQGITMVKGEQGKILRVTAVPTDENSSITYQWLCNDSAISNATDVTFSLDDAISGSYSCQVTCDGYLLISDSVEVAIHYAVPTGVNGGRLTISGVDNTMEYSTDGIHYTPVDGDSVTVSTGKYQIRKCADANFKESDTVEVLVFDAQGEYKETVSQPDGSTETTVMREDGSSTTTTEKTQDGVTTRAVVEKDKDGHTLSSTQTVTQPDGSAVKTELPADGSKVVTTYDKDGKVTEKRTYPDKDKPAYILDGYKPRMIEGGGTFNGGILVFRSDDEFCNFRQVTVNGAELSTDSYTAESGSIRVTLKVDYLNSLPSGSYTVGIVSTNGTAQGSFVIPQTSQSTPTPTPAATSAPTPSARPSATQAPASSDAPTVAPAPTPVRTSIPATGDSIPDTAALFLLSGAALSVMALRQRRQKNK